MASSDGEAGDRSCNEVNRTAEYRKMVKPLLEKKRRARMNNSLNQLKAYIVDARKSEITDPCKLEKADILEMTVRHLHDLRRQQRAKAAARANGTDESRFCAGFTECAHDVSAYLSALPDLDNALKTRLLTHLTLCVHHADRIAERKLNAQRNVYSPRTNFNHESQIFFNPSSPLALHSVNSPVQTSFFPSESPRRAPSPVWRPW